MTNQLKRIMKIAFSLDETDCIDQVNCVLKKLQTVKNVANQCLLYVDFKTQQDFGMYIESKQKELDDIYDVLHTKLDQFTIHSIYSNIYMKQLNSILERLCIIREKITKPITIDLINKNSNNIVSLINSHDLNTSEIYQLREEALQLISNVTSIELKSIILKDPNHYINLIIHIKWKFQELNNLEFHHESFQLFNNQLILFYSSLINNNNNTSIQQQNNCDSIKSLASRRREFLIQYNIQCKFFFEKLNLVKVQFEIIKQMFSCCMKQDILNNSDNLIDSHSLQSPFINVYACFNTMKQFLKSYFEQLKDYIGILDAFHYWINQVEGEFQAIKENGDTYTLTDIYYTKEMQIYMEPFRLTKLHNRLTVLNQLQINFIQHWNYKPSIHRYRTQSLCSNTALKCPPVKIKIHKRSNSSSSLVSSVHCTEIITDHPISLTYFLGKSDLSLNCSSSFFKNKKLIKNNDALITDIISNLKHSRNSIQSPCTESTSSTLCYSQNEENNSNLEEISTQIIKETVLGVIDSKNNSPDKIISFPTSIGFDEDFNLKHDNGHAIKDWTTKKEKLMENFSSFIQEYEVCSKNNTPIQTENRLEDRCTKQFRSDDHYFGSMKETSHKGNLYASVSSYLHISNDIDASSLSSCSTEKGVNFMLNDCSLHTLLSKSYNNLLQITKRFQSSLINFNKTNLTVLNNINLDNELNIDQNIFDDETQLSILNPLHSPLIIYLDRILNYFNTTSDKNDLTIKQNELTFIEHNLTNMWKYFNEIILNMKINSKQFNLADDFMKLVDNVSLLTFIFNYCIS
ncbi:unnamed protein product [Schistosoma margrebowiei]|uniref:Uncharacterized protein n=1 Tax=Schistosoma margrebowiei TaxID=48269 RepID=A0A183LEE1_9TREM|nr:unnamed protein product [Schistosoma margrebowiei]